MALNLLSSSWAISDLCKFPNKQVNTLVWKCLGYRYDAEKEEWTPEEVFPKWLEKYPTPPDMIGMQRIYSKEVDQPSLKSNQSIVRSVPVDFKQSLKTQLKPLGFKGYKVREEGIVTELRIVEKTS